MKRRLVALFTPIVLLALLFTGCGTSGATSDSASYDGGGAAPGAEGRAAPAANIGDQLTESATDGENGAVAGEADQSERSQGITTSGSSAETALNALLAERKIIRKANVSIEVDSFDEAYGKLNTIITGVGFVQESNISTEKVFTNGGQKLIKRGVIVLRVDRNKFDTVFGNVKGIGTVLEENTGTEDVTSKYYDVESRLRLLKYEQERLEAHLQRLEDLDSIFKTESRLTEIRVEIENLTVNLTKLSELVDLATITINLNEKRPDEPVLTAEISYGKRLLGNFTDSMKGVTGFLGELLIFLVGLIPVLLMLGVFTLLVVLLYKRVYKPAVKRRSVKAEAQPPSPKA